MGSFTGMYMRKQSVAGLLSFSNFFPFPRPAKEAKMASFLCAFAIIHVKLVKNHESQKQISCGGPDRQTDRQMQR